MTDIDCSYTNEIVCPYCGHEHEDSWEVSPHHEDFDFECGECGKEFSVSRNVSVTYSSEPKEETI